MGSSAPETHSYQALRSCVAQGLTSLSAILVASVIVAAPAALAQSTGYARAYSIPASQLTAALTRFGREAGIMLSFSTELTNGLQSGGLTGTHTVPAALATLLSGTQLHAVQQADGGYLLQRVAQIGTLPAVTVEGSRDPNLLYKPFPGGQVAKGARLGALGNTALIDAPFAISGYTEQAVREVQARRLIDVLAVDPSVRSTNSESTAVDVVFLRGQFLLSEDISFNETFGVVDTRRIAPEQFERIEVLKGPSALVNGISPNGTTSGGAINLVPKRGTDVPLTRVTLLGSSHGRSGGHVDIGRRFGNENQWGIRINAATRGGSTGVQNEKIGADHLSTGFDYSGEKLRVSLDLAENRRRLDGFPQFMRFSDGFRIPSPPSTDRSPSQPWDSSKTRSLSAVSRLEYDVTKNLTIFGVLGGVNYEESNLNAGAARILSALGDFSVQPSAFGFNSTIRAAEAGFKSRIDTTSVKHRIVVGYSRFTIRGQSNSASIGSAVASNLYNPTLVARPTPPALGQFRRYEDSTSDSFSIIDSMHMLDDRLRVVAGLRYQRLNFGEFRAGVESRRYRQTAIAPSAGVNYKLAPTLSVYSNYAEGLSQGPVAPGSVANAGQVFPPYKGRQVEVGVKYDSGDFGASAALFQSSQPTSFVNGDNVLVVDGEQRYRGIEVSLYGEIFKNVRVTSGLALFNAVQAKTLNGINDGKKVISVPAYSIVVNGEWDVDYIPGLTLIGRLTRVSRQMANPSNSQSIPSFSSYDLGLRYSTKVAAKPTAFRLTVENVTDSSHWIAVRNGFLSRSTPRTLLLSVSTDF